MKSSWTAGVLGVLLFVGGCDSAEPPPVPSTPTQLTMEFIPSQAGSGAAVTAVRTEEGTLHAAERLTVEPDTYRVVLTASDSTGRIDGTLFYEGQGTEVLRYAARGGLVDRLVVRKEVLDVAPLNRASAGTQQADRVSLSAGGLLAKTAPLPPPGFIAVVTGTTDAEGALRLVLERYASDAAFRQGEPPQQVDFEATFPLRIAADRDGE